MLKSQIAPVNVKVFAGLGPDGDEYPKCRITTLGSNPVTAKLWQRWDGRWHEVDTLSNASYTESGSTMTFLGTSRSLVTEVGLAPSNAQARWEVEFIGCTSCN